jgi:hypothetical protein
MGDAYRVAKQAYDKKDKTMTTRDAGLTKEQVEAAEVHAAGSSHCGEIKSKSAFSRYSTSPHHKTRANTPSPHQGHANIFIQQSRIIKNPQSHATRQRPQRHTPHPGYRTAHRAHTTQPPQAPQALDPPLIGATDRPAPQLTDSQAHRWPSPPRSGNKLILCLVAILHSRVDITQRMLYGASPTRPRAPVHRQRKARQKLAPVAGAWKGERLVPLEHT